MSRPLGKQCEKQINLKLCACMKFSKNKYYYLIIAVSCKERKISLYLQGWILSLFTLQTS